MSAASGQGAAKVAIVTGASHGIGAGLVTAYRELGYEVIATARSIASSDPGVVPVQGDIADPDTAARVVGEAIARFGRIDTLVNNAGIYIGKPFTEYTLEDFNALVAVNLGRRSQRRALTCSGWSLLHLHQPAARAPIVSHTWQAIRQISLGSTPSSPGAADVGEGHVHARQRGRLGVGDQPGEPQLQGRRVIEDPLERRSHRLLHRAPRGTSMVGDRRRRGGRVLTPNR